MWGCRHGGHVEGRHGGSIAATVPARHRNARGIVLPTELHPNRLGRNVSGPPGKHRYDAGARCGRRVAGFLRGLLGLSRKFLSGFFGPVRGPLAAYILAIQGIGWRAPTPDKMVSPRKET